MKKLIIALILFLLCATTYAAIPLVPLAAAAIGGSLLTIMGASGPGTKVSFNPSGDYSYTGPDLMVPCAVYNNYMQAGAQIALGYLSSIPFDVSGAWDQGLFQAEPSIEPVIAQVVPPTQPAPSIGNVFQIQGLPTKYKITGPPTDSGYSAKITNSPGLPFAVYGGYVAWSDLSRPQPGVSGSYVKVTCLCSVVSDPVNYPPPPALPGYLTPSQEEAVAGALAGAAANDPAVKNGLNNVVAANPGLLSSPGAISPADVKAWASAAGAAAANDRIAELQAAVAANPNDTALAAELAKAIADQAIKSADEVKDQAEKQEDYSANAPPLPSVTLKEIDLGPIKALSGSLTGKFPFYIAPLVGSLFSSLVAEPVAPSFVIDAPPLLHQEIDFSSMNSFASMFRLAASCLFYALAAWQCVKIFSRF